MESSSIPTAYRNSLYYRVSRLRMPFTYLMVLLAIIFAPAKLCFPWLAVIFIGMAIRVLAAGHVVKRHKLSKGGPYAFTRHPLYLGSFLWGLGIFLLMQNWWLVIVFLGGFAVFYGSAIRSEEEYLEERHGEEQVFFKRSVPIFIPRIIPASSLQESRFSWEGVLRNNEHKSFALSAAVVLAVILRSYFS